MAAEVGRHICWQLVHRVDAHKHVSTAARNEERIGRPAQAEDIISVATKCTVERKWGEGALKRGCGPDLHKPADREGHPFAIGSEGHGRNLGLEVEVRDDNTPAHVSEQQVPFIVYRDHDGAVGRQSDLRNIAAGFEWKCEAARTHKVKALHTVADGTVEQVACWPKD
eukprot:scaffold314064_cov32-Tisochrysis_lutea.AAC.1